MQKTAFTYFKNFYSNMKFIKVLSQCQFFGNINYDAKSGSSFFLNMTIFIFENNIYIIQFKPDIRLKNELILIN